MSDKKKGFSITCGKGFHMTFSNGVTISVQWGPGNYCDNRNENSMDEKGVGEKGSNTAEVAIWSNHDNGKEWITRGVYKILGNENVNDDVVGWCNPDSIADLIYFCSNMNTTDIERVSAASIVKNDWDDD